MTHEGFRFVIRLEQVIKEGTSDPRNPIHRVIVHREHTIIVPDEEFSNALASPISSVREALESS